MLTRTQKEQLLQEIQKDLQESLSVVFVDYRGLNVSDTQKFKRTLSEEGGMFRVVKKTLLLRALKEQGTEVDEKAFDGQVAVIFSKKDEISAVKTLQEMIKAKKPLRILAGVLGREVMSVQQVESLAKMPSKEQLLGTLVGTIQAPLSGFVRVLSGNMQGLLTVLDGVASKKGEEK